MDLPMYDTEVGICDTTGGAHRIGSQRHDDEHRNGGKSFPFPRDVSPYDHDQVSNKSQRRVNPQDTPNETRTSKVLLYPGHPAAGKIDLEYERVVTAQSGYGPTHWLLSPRPRPVLHDSLAEGYRTSSCNRSVERGRRQNTWMSIALVICDSGRCYRYQLIDNFDADVLATGIGISTPHVSISKGYSKLHVVTCIWFHSMV